ncbi:MAG: D-glycero-alpha-D-manno-heptose-1,7-bisphosphate 7-phosphatase [Longimicrobiales bacterium]
MTPARPAVFLDRDGVLNDVVERDGQPASPRTMGELRLAADLAAVNRFAEAGRLVFIVTNQPDIARGHVSTELAGQIADRIRSRVHIDDTRVCAHDDEDACACRKPKPGMLLDLARHWHVDLARSWMIGDMWRDVEAARAAGCRSVLIRRPYNRRAAADLEADTLAEAVALVLVHGGGAQ